jgi:hypothetical protein
MAAARPSVALGSMRPWVPTLVSPFATAASAAGTVYPRRNGVAEVQWRADVGEAADVDARVVFVPSGSSVSGLAPGSAATADLEAASVGAATLLHLDGGWPFPRRRPAGLPLSPPTSDP